MMKNWSKNEYLENSVFKKITIREFQGKFGKNSYVKKMGGQKKMFDTGCTLYIKLIFVRTDNLGSFGLFCLLCGFRQLGNLFGTDRNGFRIGGGLLSFALSGFFVFFFGLAVLGLTVRVSVFGITVLGIAI